MVIARDHAMSAGVRRGAQGGIQYTAISNPENAKHFGFKYKGVPNNPPPIIIMQSSYFGSHSSAGKVKVASSSDLLHALKIQTIYNANQTSKITPTAIHSNPPELRAQFNAVSQQINYGVKRSYLS